MDDAASEERRSPLVPREKMDLKEEGMVVTVLVVIWSRDRQW